MLKSTSVTVTQAARVTQAYSTCIALSHELPLSLDWRSTELPCTVVRRAPPLQVGVSLAAQAGLTLGYHTLAFLALLRNGPRMQPLSKLGGATVKPEKAVDTNELAGTDAAQLLAPASEKAAVDAPQPVA